MTNIISNIISPVVSGVVSPVINTPLRNAVGFFVANNETYTFGVTPAEGDVVSFIFKGTGNAGVLLKDPLTFDRYTLVFEDGSAVWSLNDGVSTIIDGVSYDNTITRDELQALICDDELHEISVTMGANVALWTDYQIAGYGGGFEIINSYLLEVKLNDVLVNGQVEQPIKI